MLLRADLRVRTVPDRSRPAQGAANRHRRPQEHAAAKVELERLFQRAQATVDSLAECRAAQPTCAHILRTKVGRNDTAHWAEPRTRYAQARLNSKINLVEAGQVRLGRLRRRSSSTGDICCGRSSGVFTSCIFTRGCEAARSETAL